jgi:hypothetical protein
MRYSIAALAVAAHRAKDVATLVDAARVVTFLARSRAQECPNRPHEAQRQRVTSIYRVAGQLATYGRELAAETDRLLTAAENAQPELLEVRSSELDEDIEVLRALLVASMNEAVAAIDMLENIQELGADDLDAPPLGTTAFAEQRQAIEQLFARLRRCD